MPLAMLNLPLAVSLFLCGPAFATGRALDLPPPAAVECDSDADADGVCDDEDPCVGDNESRDADADGWCARSIDGSTADCDDADGATYPGAPEQCDGVNNACDGADPTLELDTDGDGVRRCADDCDDLDARTFPGADELCDGADNDCDGMSGADESDEDDDGTWVCEGDCDDADPSSYVGAVDVCGDGVDNDCNATIDDACAPSLEDAPEGCWCSSSGSAGSNVWMLAVGGLIALVWRRRC